MYLKTKKRITFYFKYKCKVEENKSFSVLEKNDMKIKKKYGFNQTKTFGKKSERKKSENEKKVEKKWVFEKQKKMKKNNERKKIKKNGFLDSFFLRLINFNRTQKRWSFFLSRMIRKISWKCSLLGQKRESSSKKYRLQLFLFVFSKNANISLL